jgi:hypothetical protein
MRNSETMNTKFYLLTVVFGLLVFSIRTNAEGPTQEMKLYAASYGLDEKEAPAHLEGLFSSKHPQQLAALDYFVQHKAYRVIAAALPVLDDSLKGEAIVALERANKRDVVVISALLKELEERTHEIKQFGEVLAGHRMVKEKLVAIISRLSGVAGKDVNPQSLESVRKFIGAVRAVQVVEPDKPVQEPPPTNSLPAKSSQ